MQRPTSNESQPQRVEHVRNGFKSVCHFSSVDVIKVCLQLVCTSSDIIRPLCICCFLSVWACRSLLFHPVCLWFLPCVPLMVDHSSEMWGKWRGGSVLSVVAVITACCQDAMQEVYCGRANRLHLSPGGKQMDSTVISLHLQSGVCAQRSDRNNIQVRGGS